MAVGRQGLILSETRSHVESQLARRQTGKTRDIRIEHNREQTDELCSC
jgi:hypothetical protein